MQTTEDFIKKYEAYSNDELLEMHDSLQDYSVEAREAFKIVISRKGGEENLIRLKDKKIVLGKEYQRIHNEVSRLTTSDVDISFLKKMISSEILTQEELDHTLENMYSKAKDDLNDTEVTSHTIFGSVFGGIVASIAGGIYMGLQLIYSPRIFYILIFGLVLLCYWIVYLFARKSYKNQSVIIATIISVVLSFLLGKLLFLIVGDQGSIQ